MVQDKKIEFPAWYGELGWEIMTWIPQCRKQAQGYEQVIASSFADMQPLYADFVTDFIAHDQKSRSLTYPKNYYTDGKFIRYGWANPIFDILIHARGINRKSSINYRNWFELTRLLKTYRIAFIGGIQDQFIKGLPNLRGINLIHLTDLMAGAKLTIGASSGVMHLAAACGCNLVVWGDRRTYFGETLEQRYKFTWNPFNVKVGWIDADNWQPEPEKIMAMIEKMI